MAEGPVSGRAKVTAPPAGATGDTRRAEKARLRAWAKDRRAQLSAAYREYAAAAALAHVERAPEFQAASTVMAYASLLGEVDTFPILSRILAERKRLILPRVSPDRSDLEIYEVRLLEHDLRRQGKLGVLEPLPTRCRMADRCGIALVLMPGLVFDARGGRIGYGAGYFDRFLLTLCPLPPLIAVAFDFQILPRIPQFSEDVPMDGYATENGLYRVRRRQWSTARPEETHAAARELDALLPPDAVVGLCGELGSGKTEWTRGFFAPRMVRPEEIASPSYALQNVYEGTRGPLRHVDLYRLARAPAGGAALPERKGIHAQPGRPRGEWGDVLAASMPRETVWVDFTVASDGARRLDARWLEKVD